MTHRHALPIVVIASALCGLAALSRGDRAANAAPPADRDPVAAQVKELQKQVAELQARLGESERPRVVAAGTVSWERPDVLANRTSVRVKLPADVAAGLGRDSVVLLTNRFPQNGYPYLSPYWSAAPGGFDVTLVEPTLGNGSSVEYARGTRTYLVDWAVVRK